MDKMQSVFAEIRDHLLTISRENQKNWSSEIDFNSGKISKGENYLSLPYMVLDFPSYFSKKNIFAYRTMFWWSNYFSATLHLGGNYLSEWRTNTLENMELLTEHGIYICTGQSQWEHDLESDDHDKLSAKHEELIRDWPFLKLSVKISLSDVDILSERVGNFWKLIQSIKSNG
ncbi:MAG: hypothetical protein OEQ53_14325 [Saprospiraceae bacterium]|nr:hypothetical protein [Saprospiraceae bacterium]